MHILKRSLLLVGVTAFALTACKDDDAVTPTARVNSVTVTPQTANVRVGSTVTLVADVDADGGAATTVNWSTADGNRAQVSATGVVTAGNTVGPVVITATSTVDATKKGSATVIVEAGQVLSVEVLPTEVTLYGGQTAQLAAVVNTESGVANTVTWSITPSDNSVASVSTAGVVTAAANNTTGVRTAVVTATSTADPNKRGAATIRVNPGQAPSGVLSVQVNPGSATMRFGDPNQVFTAQVQASGGVATTVNWNVSDPTKVTIISQTANSITVRPINGTVTGQVAIQATSTVDAGKSGAAVLNILPPLTPATVSINSVNVGGTLLPVNPLNVAGQIDVIANIDPGDFIITKIELLIDGKPVAVQTLAPSGAAAEVSQIVMSYNTGRYGIPGNPDPTLTTTCLAGNPAPPTGHACVDFFNGEHVVSLRITTSNGSVTGVATSVETNLTFMNVPGFHMRTVAPTNSVTGSNGQVWFGGPSGPTTAVSSWPVRYDNRVITGLTLCSSSLAGAAPIAVGAPGPGTTCSTDTAAPFSVNLTIAQSNVPGTPVAYGFVNGAASLVASGGDGLPVAIPAISAANGQALLNAQTPINVDNTAPTGQAFTLPAAPNNWVNASTNFTTFVTRGTDAGVGIAAASTDIYRYWDLPSTTRITFTANAHGIPEDPIDFTNSAYDAEVLVHDLLGNQNIAGSILFGVDVTAPSAEYMGPLTAAAANALVAKTTADSIMNNLVANTQGLTSATALFGARYRDTRSGFDVATGGIYRRITRFGSSAFGATAEGSGTSANTCSGTGFHVRLIGAIGADDPTYRRDSLAVFGSTGGFTAATPGIYTYTTCAKDRAGNESVTITKRVLVDVAAPQITGLQIPAILTGGTFPAFTPTGLDDHEVSQGGLYFTYPNLAALSAGATTRIYYPPFTPGNTWPAGHGAGTPGFNYEEPSARAGAFNSVLCSPVGPLAPCGDVPKLTAPLGFLLGIDVVAAGDSTPPGAVTATYKPDSVGAMLFDVKRLEATLKGATPDSSVSGLAGTPVLMVPILSGLVANGTPFSAIGVGKFFVFAGGTTSGTVQARAMTNTSVTNPPFPQVAFFRYDAATPAGVGRWVHIGTVNASAPTNPTIFDQGVDRFWTYSLTGVSPSLATGQQVIAVGMSTNGNGLASRPHIMP